MNGAEVALKKAAELDKNNSDALIKLGQVQAAKGSLLTGQPVWRMDFGVTWVTF